jgi:drug/metabolite transporter (DMT)-like permease
MTAFAIRIYRSAAGPLLMLGAALSFTIMNILVKTIGPEFRVWDLAFYRFAGGFAILVVFLGRAGNPFRGYNIPLLMVRGCTGSIALVLLYGAIRLLPVSTAMVLFFSFPAYAAIFSFLIFGERVTPLGIVCIVAMMIGVMILFDFQVGGGLLGQVFGVLGAVFAGLTVTLIKALRAKNGPAVIYLYLCTMGMMVTFPAYTLGPVLPWPPDQLAICGGIVLSALTAQLLMNHGFFYCTSLEGGVFMSMEVVFTAMIGIAFLNDPVGWRFTVGSLLIVGSVLALNIAKARSGQRAPRR